MPTITSIHTLFEEWNLGTVGEVELTFIAKDIQSKCTWKYLGASDDDWGLTACLVADVTQPNLNERKANTRSSSGKGRVLYNKLFQAGTNTLKFNLGAHLLMLAYRRYKDAKKRNDGEEPAAGDWQWDETVTTCHLCHKGCESCVLPHPDHCCLLPDPVNQAHSNLNCFRFLICDGCPQPRILARVCPGTGGHFCTLNKVVHSCHMCSSESFPSVATTNIPDTPVTVATLEQGPPMFQTP